MKHRSELKENILAVVIFALITTAVAAMPFSIFVNYNTWQTNELLKKRLATNEFIQEGILLNNYNYTRKCK